MNWRWRILHKAHALLVGQTEVQLAQQVLSKKGVVSFNPEEHSDDVCLALLCLRETSFSLQGSATKLYPKDILLITDNRSDKSKPLLTVES